MTNYGFRVIANRKHPDKKILDAYKSISTSVISDNLNRLTAVEGNIRPRHNSGKLVGSALTVRVSPGDNLMVHKAVEIVMPGEVIVVDAGGAVNNAIFGEIMACLAEKNGAAGFVTDGAIRDIASIAAGSFPVYAKGITHRGPFKNGPGEINVPVSVGGAVINPGDILVGDEDGIAVVPFEAAEEILKLAQAQEAAEQKLLDAIRNDNIDRSWIDKLLQDKKCDFS